MATDIKLDQQGGDWLIVEGRILKTTASDFMLDSPARRRGGPSPHRRALVHNEQDGLTLNFAGERSKAHGAPLERNGNGIESYRHGAPPEHFAPKYIPKRHEVFSVFDGAR